jgi:hypothetical protein
VKEGRPHYALVDPKAVDDAFLRLDTFPKASDTCCLYLTGGFDSGKEGDAGEKFLDHR